ncbi:hypothetical protein [Streptomyces sp. NBC_01477]|uniref:hypothetical protein n=1 Tax=Streptomyces sp. NBC_01477 TaxID=2976015 RepID=UPI002E36FCF0|nr:hypothetical protein [Streptomyces sp. NBC_01477]
MTASGCETYSPEDDPAVYRWQQESEKRANGEAAGADPEERPVGGAYQLEDARRLYLATILQNALATVRGRELDSPDAEQLSLLDDFFTRAVVFPDPHGNGVHPRPHQALFGWSSEPPGIDHASEPGRALAVFLLAYLDHHGMVLTKSARPSVWPAPPVERSGAGRPSVRDAEQGEGSEAPAELVERVLAVWEQHYAAVTGTSGDRWEAESRDVVGIALRTVKLADRDAYPQVLEEFLRANRARLERLWARYGPGGLFAEEVVLVDMAACYVLCERIEAVPLWLKGVWDQEATALERLHDAWRYDTRDKDGGR